MVTDQELAQLSVAEIRRATKASHKRTAQIRVGAQSKSLQIPKKALDMLVTILKNMAEGKSVTLISSDINLSTQQVADLLHVSRPNVVALLEEGVIPYTKAGTHRRVELKHALEYQKKKQQIRKKQLNFLTEQAQELNLGY